MKRSVALLAALAVAGLPLAAEAAPKPKPRTATFSYTGPGGAGANGVGSVTLTSCPGPGMCFAFETVKGEKLVKVEAKDQTGRPVGLQVWLDGDYAGSVALYCGTAEVKVAPKAAHQVSIRTTLVESCQGVPTQGTITATITK